ncbi:hypothetical protein EZV62_003645 [Acer yangbiense]|uniref:Malectin-like domain-containing protein n=1 Tax=Acer yangbiense TaxID=1000413 RepID=A0A5C7IHE5_9ROSI|nr:hypothetical protein EZV62_003645 [Acer yangbiense]
MVDRQPSFLVLQLCLVLVSVIITVRNSKLAGAYGEHAKRKLQYQADSSGNFDLGGNSDIRYPEDVFDRYWFPYNDSDWLVMSTKSTIQSSADGSNYKVPDKLLQTAAASKSASVPLSLAFKRNLDPDSVCYIYFHFAEIEILDNESNRELKIEVNGVRNLSSEPATLEYLMPMTKTSTGLPMSADKEISFKIYAAEGSDLPPILNAVENANSCRCSTRYYSSNWLNEKSDTYSFGVVLLEIITSKPVILTAPENTHISKWVNSMLAGGDIRSIVDPKLSGDFEKNSAWKAVELALSCTSQSSSERPTMIEVVMELKECLALATAGNGEGHGNKTKGPRRMLSVDVIADQFSTSAR